MGPVDEVVAHECVLSAEYLGENRVQLVASVVAVTVAVGALHVDIADFVVDERLKYTLTVVFRHAVELRELRAAEFHCLFA